MMRVWFISGLCPLRLEYISFVSQQYNCTSKWRGECDRRELRVGNVRKG